MLFRSNRALSCRCQGSCGSWVIACILVQLTFRFLLKRIGVSHSSFRNLEPGISNLLGFWAFRTLWTCHLIASWSTYVVLLGYCVRLQLFNRRRSRVLLFNSSSCAARLWHYLWKSQNRSIFSTCPPLSSSWIISARTCCCYVWMQSAKLPWVWIRLLSLPAFGPSCIALSTLAALWFALKLNNARLFEVHVFWYRILQGLFILTDRTNRSFWLVPSTASIIACLTIIAGKLLPHNFVWFLRW